MELHCAWRLWLIPSIFARHSVSVGRVEYPAAFDLANKFRVRLMKGFHKGEAKVADE
jgi:hypothetical protein